MSGCERQKEGVEEIRQEFERLRKVHNDNWEIVGEGLREYYATFEERRSLRPSCAIHEGSTKKGPYRAAVILAGQE